MNPGKRVQICSDPQAVLGLVLLGTLFSLTGCIGALPLPALTCDVEQGRQITASQVAFIRRGQTTREQIVSHLGTNYVALPYVIAYSWELKGGGVLWWVYVPCPGADGVMEVGRRAGGWRAFFVAFDERGAVRATAFKSLSPSQSLHSHMEKWVRGLPAESTMIRR